MVDQVSSPTLDSEQVWYKSYQGEEDLCYIRALIVRDCYKYFFGIVERCY